MSADFKAASPTTEADPPAAGAPAPNRIGRVLALVRRLIDYGRHLAVTVQQRTTAPDFALFAKPFGTADIDLILARITAGLRRAVALEAALNRRAASGRDLTPSPAPAPRSSPPEQAAPANARPKPRRADRTEDPHLAHLPSAEEIAADVRRRPVGAVIADICRDLGIAPGRVDPAFWHELSRTILTYGGSFVNFLKDLDRRWFGPTPEGRADHGCAAASPRLPAPATGPP